MPRPCSFEEKLAQLKYATAEANWDGEGGVAIPEAQWDRLRTAAAKMTKSESKIGEAHPSAGGDGSVHARCAHGPIVIDVEIMPEGREHWSGRYRLPSGAAHQTGEEGGKPGSTRGT